MRHRRRNRTALYRPSLCSSFGAASEKGGGGLLWLAVKTSARQRQCSRLPGPCRRRKGTLSCGSMGFSDFVTPPLPPPESAVPVCRVRMRQVNFAAAEAWREHLHKDTAEKYRCEQRSVVQWMGFMPSLVSKSLTSRVTHYIQCRPSPSPTVNKYNMFMAGHVYSGGARGLSIATNMSCDVFSPHSGHPLPMHGPLSHAGAAMECGAATWVVARPPPIHGLQLAQPRPVPCAGNQHGGVPAVSRFSFIFPATHS